MNIYIENVILFNSILNISFIKIISKILKIKINYLKLIISSILSTIFTLIFTQFVNNIIIFYFLQLIILLFFITFSFKNINYKKIIQITFLYILLSNIYTGIMSNIFKSKYNSMIIFDSAVLFLISIFCLILCSNILIKILKFVSHKLKRQSNICDIELEYNNKKIKCFGYVDTGNNMLIKKVPVNFISFDLFTKLTGITLKDYLSKNFDSQIFEYIDVNTLNGKNKLLMFKINSLKIENFKEVINDANIAVSLKLSNKDYSLILNNNYFT